MKNLKIISVTLCCMAAMFFASCNTDENKYSLTKEEVATCLNAVKGNYTGKLIYPNQNPNNSNDKTDSLNIQWSANLDTTITVKQFPVSLLSNYVEDNTLKDALANAPSQDLKCGIYFTNVSPVVFLVNPTSISVSLNYGGKTHQVKARFYVNTLFSYGAYTSAKKEMQYQVLLHSIIVDEGHTNYLTKETPFLFTGTKL